MPVSILKFIRLFLLLLLSIFVQMLPAQVASNIENRYSQPDTLERPSTGQFSPVEIKTDSIPGDSLDAFGFPITPPTSVRQRTREVISQPSYEEPDSLPRSAIKWFTEEQLQNPFALRPNYVDTTLLGMQMYDYAFKGHYFIAQKGNPGHVHRQLLFNPEMNPGLITGERSLYGNYFFTHENLKFYRPTHVFSELNYIIGADREQLFFGNHAQKLNDNLHMNFQYRLVNSPGAYSRLGARNSGVYLTADYLSPDRRYQVLGSVIHNRVRSQESGGLKNHLSFEAERVRDSVVMYRAESWGRETSVNLRHFYQTGFYSSDKIDNIDNFINLGRINHDFTYRRTSFVMNDSDNPHFFYPDEKLNPNNTFDSTVVYRVENLISWSNYPLGNRRSSIPFNFRIYLKHSLNTILQPAERPVGAPELDEERKRIYYYTRDRFTSIVQGVELQSDQRKFLSISGYANLTLGGYNDDDFHAGATMKFGKPDRKYRFEGMVRYSRMEAPYFFNKISVNEIRWRNDFSKIQIANARANLILPFLTIEGNYYLIDRAVYLGLEALPVQNNEEIGFFSLGAYSDIKAGPFGFRNHILFQQATSKNFENFPTVISYHSIFANFYLSDKALVNQAGFDFHFNTSYPAMAYMPYVRGFYIQNSYTNAEKFLVDVFWNAKVGNARLFIKYQNLLPLVFNIRPHYDIPFYPIPESLFKFGVSWMFFN